MAYPTIVVAAGTFDAYVSVAIADAYLGAAYHADSWAGLTNENKGRALITAVRMLDRQAWLGTKTVESQSLDWPRTDTGVDGVEDAVVPQDIEFATMELALSLVDGSDIQSTQSTAQRIQSMSAGSVSITNFRSVDTPTRFPQIVQELVGKYLGGNASGFVAQVNGVDTETVFPSELGYNTGGI
jgi:hypothetical protein